MDGIEKVTMRELPDFEDSLAFFNLNFGAVCPLNIEVCNTEPRPIHLNATGEIIDLIRWIQQKAFFSSIKFQDYLLMSFHSHANKSPLYSEKASMRLDDVKTSQR